MDRSLGAIEPEEPCEGLVQIDEPRNARPVLVREPDGVTFRGETLDSLVNPPPAADLAPYVTDVGRMLPEAGADRARRFPRAAGLHDSLDIRRRERSWNREGRCDMTEEIRDIQRDPFPRN